MRYFKAFIREFAIPIATALVVIALAIQAFKIPSGSMENTLYEGDFLLGLKFIYGIPIPFSKSRIAVSDPKINDVVIFRYPGEPEYPDYNTSRYAHLANALMLGNFFWDKEAPSGSPKLIHYADGPKDYIKRCVAKSGQTVAVKDGKLFLDGTEQALGEGGGKGKYTERYRDNSPRDQLKEIRLPIPGETIKFDTLSARNLWWIRSLMVQEMPDSLVEFNISLTKNGKELEDYKFENFSVPIENHKWLLISTLINQSRIVPQALRPGDTISGEINLSFFRKYARTGFIPRHNPSMPQKSMFGSRLVGYEAFDGSQLEDLAANVKKMSEPEFTELTEFTELKNSSEFSLKYQILVNGKVVDEYTVRDNVYFMMGDNRDNSADSRYWGFVAARNIKAKAFIIYFSLDKGSRVELLKPWTWVFLPNDVRWSRVARIIHLI